MKQLISYLFVLGIMHILWTFVANVTSMISHVGFLMLMKTLLEDYTEGYVIGSK
jgi:hypothetical protein